MKSYAIGLDLGGTYLKGGIVSEDGKLIEYTKIPSKVNYGPHIVLKSLSNITNVLFKKAEDNSLKIEGIGVVSAGIMDPVYGGVLGGADNLPGWGKTPFMKYMFNEFKIPIFAHNDVTATTLGEIKYGAGVGKRNVVLASFGTGIGGGIVIDGKLFEGKTGYAGEIGHMAIFADGFRCTCGIKGCWEEYAAIRGIVRTSKTLMDKSKDNKSIIYKKVKENNGEITPKIIFDAAKNKDTLGSQIVDIVGKHTAIGVGSLINIFNPEMFIIGGGIAEAGKIYLDAILKHIKDWTLKDSIEAVEIVLAKLGYKAGLIGAAALVFCDINRYIAKK